MAPTHIPVLFQEALSLLAPSDGEAFLDGTVGAGGHAEAIAALVGPGGILVGNDGDPAALEAAGSRLSRFPWAKLVHGDFSDLPALREAAGGRAFDGILLDLGISSLQLDDPGRGLSFRSDGPLDMRRDPSAGGATAREILRRTPEKALADLFYRFGDEWFSRRIARAVVARREKEPLESTVELARLVAAAIPRKAWPREIHPATKVFQALRIAVNRELDSLSSFLDEFPLHLAPGGRVAVISFHSLEDRLVKEAFRRHASAGKVEILTRKPVVPGEEECRENPRARSARLRAARKTAAQGGDA